jgi:hypothetical protein
VVFKSHQYGRWQAQSESASASASDSVILKDLPDGRGTTQSFSVVMLISPSFISSLMARVCPGVIVLKKVGSYPVKTAVTETSHRVVWKVSSPVRGSSWRWQLTRNLAPDKIHQLDRGYLKV